MAIVLGGVRRKPVVSDISYPLRGCIDRHRAGKRRSPQEPRTLDQETKGRSRHGGPLLALVDGVGLGGLGAQAGGGGGGAGEVAGEHGLQEGAEDDLSAAAGEGQ